MKIPFVVKLIYLTLFEIEQEILNPVVALVSNPVAGAGYPKVTLDDNDRS